MKSEIRVKEYDIKSYERNLKKLEDESSARERYYRKFNTLRFVYVFIHTG